MKQSLCVFRIQLALFKREKGMLIFYLLCVVINGMIVPIFLHNIESSLTMAALLTVMFLKPMLSDSLAGERERKTLESLLSASISGKRIIVGKFQFCLLFGLAFFIITIAFTTLTNWLAGYKLEPAVWQWSCVIVLAAFNLSAISIAGVYVSATSQDLRTATGKVSRIAYPLGLLLLVCLSVVFMSEPLPAIFTGFILFLIDLCIILVYAIKVLRMEQSSCFEISKDIKGNKLGEKNKDYRLTGSLKSQFWIVFIHELKYLKTLKTMLVNFLILCLAPGIVICLLKYYTGKINLDFAVLVTALMMPRVPTNLIAYSIGGEKTYKTGESLLSTPLSIRPLFLAKCTIPILVSIILLTLSSLITLAGANLIGSYFESGSVYHYTADQLMLLFPVSMMTCIIMVFITGLLSVNMKNPRQGLYVSSILGIIFVFPPLVIVYMTQNIFVWSVIYFIGLFLCNVICVISISHKIGRPQIMSRL